MKAFGTPSYHPRGEYPGNLTNVNGILYFTANDGTYGNELWQSDGTEHGTRLVKDIYHGTTGSNPSKLTNVNGTLFFAANDGFNGCELWKSDGTATGTALVKNINQRPLIYLPPPSGTPAPPDTDTATTWGAFDNNISEFVNMSGSLYFVAHDGHHGYELWKSDGTPANTQLVKDIDPSFSPDNPINRRVDILGVAGGLVYLQANDGSHGSELWVSDGTEQGTQQVRDIALGAASSNPQDLINFNGILYFTAENGTNGRELWRSDGTSSGTQIVRDIQPGMGTSKPRNFAVAGKVMYFSASDGTRVQAEILRPHDLALAHRNAARHRRFEAHSDLRTPRLRQQLRTARRNQLPQPHHGRTPRLSAVHHKHIVVDVQRLAKVLGQHRHLPLQLARQHPVTHPALCSI